MKVQDDVLRVLSAATVDGRNVRLPPAQLDRKLYERVNAALAAIGGKWTSGKVKAHVFSEDPSERLEGLLLTGEVRTAAEDGWFPTPDALADRVVTTLKLGPSDDVLEPSAGEGALALAVLRASTVRSLTMIERDAARATRLKARLPRIPPCPLVVAADDFLSVAADPAFDAVVMNPPFAKGQGVDHVNHALRFLRSGGRLAAILPASILFREDRRHAELRGRVLDAGGSIEQLPPGSFRTSDTDVNTALLTLRLR